MIDKVGNTVTLTGSAFTGRGGGFFAYQLFESGDLNRPVLAFGGTPFEKPQGEADQLRLCDLHTDPRQDIGIPFAAKATSPTNLAGATIQPLYLLEDSGDGKNPGRSVWLQTSFLIKGEGPTQETIIVLALGEQGEDGQLEGFRRGMSHVPVTINVPDEGAPGGTSPFTFMQTYNLGGKISTLAGADGETHLFGTTLPHFVIGADSTGRAKTFSRMSLFTRLDSPATSLTIHRLPLLRMWWMDPTRHPLLWPMARPITLVHKPHRAAHPRLSLMDRKRTSTAMLRESTSRRRTISRRTRSRSGSCSTQTRRRCV